MSSHRLLKNGMVSRRMVPLSSNVKITQPSVAGFENARGPWAKEYRQLSEAGKDQESDSPL